MGIESKETEETGAPDIQPVITDSSGSNTKLSGRLLQQIGFNMLAAGLVMLVAVLVYQTVFSKEEIIPTSIPEPQPTAVQIEEFSTTEDSNQSPLQLASFDVTNGGFSVGIPRKADIKTIIPSRPRVDVITYTVQKGDTLFSIADAFRVKPETLLWGNFEVLEDNPHLLSPNQVLNILPINGIYYQWKEGDSLPAIAGQFNANPDDIVNFTGNNFDLVEMQEGNGEIEPGTWMVIPDGTRPIKDWGPPAITRSDPASAKYYGAGHCGEVYEGAFGTGTYVWPTIERSVIGYNFSNLHPAVDLGGGEGSPIFATDSGVVVYAGWSDYGYGNLIVIDHGNGWQSAYAHLLSVGVSCGMSVYQGGTIGSLGSTGNSSGPHLHFELVYGGAKLNPLDYLQ
ncbi:MAG: peptidoglycan DD-metalloendopeptidase family protein [Anaerolineales bacterium]|jgi:murein DD-endopeptidase MepM/ murein hydrolase activator NlpD